MIKIPSYISKVETLADGGAKLAITTNEVAPSDMAEIFAYAKQFGWFVFAPEGTNIKEEDIPDEPIPDMKGEKTPSQRLRARLFVYYKETKGTEKGFNHWYSDTLDEIGTKYLERLN